MTLASARRPTIGRAAVAGLLRAPGSARTWLGTIHLVHGAVIGLVTMSVIVTWASTTLLLAVTAVLAVPTYVAMLWCGRWFTGWQRSRFAALLGVDLRPPPDLPTTGTWWQRLVARSRARTTWRELEYHTLAALVNTVTGTVVIGLWSASAVLATLALHVWTLPRPVWYGLQLRDPAVLVGLTLLGLLGLLVTPWVVSAFVQLDVAMARSLLEPRDDERVSQLRQRVQDLSESRAGLVDAADAERRRIERDLHDGTQQRLVSLAMNLGTTRATLGDDAPAPVREAVARAHDEAKQALAELRDFVRGLHPAVLDDLGLDAALSGLTARSPVPVALWVNLPRRPSSTIEAVAYFVVSEALTNVAKHAHATQIEVRVDQVADAAGQCQVRLVVADNGNGGARLDRGTGLRGLGQRIGSVDGTLTIDSPLGGPTLIVVELPCEL